MNYNRALEISILKFLRVRIGTSFTPEELLKEISKLTVATQEEFNILMRTMSVEELIEVSASVGVDTYEFTRIISFTKGGLELLRDKNY